MEKSWNFETGAKSPGKVIEFDKQFCILIMKRCYPAAFQNPSAKWLVHVCWLRGQEYSHGKIMEFCRRNFVATLVGWMSCVHRVPSNVLWRLTRSTSTWWDWWCRWSLAPAAFSIHQQLLEKGIIPQKMFSHAMTTYLSQLSVWIDIVIPRISFKIKLYQAWHGIPVEKIQELQALHRENTGDFSPK